MKTYRHFLSTLVWATLLIPVVSSAQYPWSTVISPARAVNWSTAGLLSSTPDVPPDASWMQCGTTIAAYGTSGTPASPSTIQSAINACGTDEYVLLGSGDFYLTGNVSLKSNVVLRGSGANQTRIHIGSGSVNWGCNGPWGVVCIVGSNSYAQGGCTAFGISNVWSCPPGTYVASYPNAANWTGSYSQGSSTITLDNVSGIVLNQTPIVLDQCDVGFTGTTGDEGCSHGTAGAITAASVASGGSGYNVGDTGTITCAPDDDYCFGTNTATYNVTSVSSGAVTAFIVTSGGNGYSFTTTGTGGSPATTIAKSGSGSGLTVSINGINGYDNSGLFACSMTMICEDQGPAGTSRPARSQQETVMATAISGSGPYTVTINRPLAHNNWASGQNPQAWWGSSTITNAGVEDVSLDPSVVDSSCVVMSTASNVWVTDIACNQANDYHVAEYMVSNSLVRDSYLYFTKYAGTTSYGLGSNGAVGGALYENNIIQGVVDPLNPSGGCSYCVFAYNFSVNDYYGTSAYMLSSSPMHGASTDYILEEGNIGAGVDLDSIHGPHYLNTFFRNYFTGYESNNGTMPSYDTVPVSVAAFSRYNNFVANVLGTAGYDSNYQCNVTAPTSPSCTTTPQYSWVWDLGWSHGYGLYDYNNSPPLPDDPLTTTSTLRYGNYDVVKNAVQWNSAEVPTADPNFPNMSPSNAFQASFYNGVTAAHSSCGTGLNFWRNPTTGTCPPYPNIGPDVSGGDIGMCTSGTYKWARALSSSQCAGGSFQAGTETDGGYGNSNPAMRCYLNQMSGPPDGTGSMLTFNPSSCYAPDSAGPAVQPSPANGASASYTIVL